MILFGDFAIGKCGNCDAYAIKARDEAEIIGTVFDEDNQ